MLIAGPHNTVPGLNVRGYTMMKLYVFGWVPDFAKGLVRDLRVRWALEEAGLPYEEQVINHEEKLTDSYKALQPFGQVPVIEDGDLKLFESGAIALHIAEQSNALLPGDANGKARATAWMIAALNSMEVAIQGLVEIDIFNAEAEWAKERRPAVIERLEGRLTDLSNALGDKTYLDGDTFTVGDLMMVTVLRILRHTDILSKYPNLTAYKERCEARPAFKKALADQLATFDREDELQATA